MWQQVVSIAPTLDVADFQVVIARAAPTGEELLHLPGAGLDLHALERSLLVQALRRSAGILRDGRAALDLPDRRAGAPGRGSRPSRQ